MNLRLFIILCGLLSLNLTAQGKIDFDSSGYNSVMQRAKKEHKPVFYMLYATWCAHCNKMKQEVFTDTLVSNFINKHYISAWQDIEKGEGEMFKKKFGIKFFPTFIFFDENGKELYNISGEFKPAEFVTEAKNALIPEKQLPYLEAQFNADVSNADKCLAYLSALNKGRDRQLLSPIAAKYLATQKDEQLISANNWKIIANGVTDIQSREFQYVLGHIKEFEGVSSAKRVQRKIENTVNEFLSPAVELSDTLTYHKRRAIAQTINMRRVDSLLFGFDTQLAVKVNNWKNYRKATAANTEKFVWNDAKTLLDIAGNYQKNIVESTALLDAIKWTQRAISLNETYDAEILLARLYLKNKDKKMAQEWAEKAKAKNAAFGWKTAEADEILSQIGTKN
ncbi:MAG: thioredoxin fold domain-containing protein [Flavobacteriaceae bacterium]